MRLSVRDITEAVGKFETCHKLKQANSWAKLVKLLLSPRGEDFFRRNRFPTLDHFRSMGCILSKYDVFLDAGNIVINNCRRAILVGNTEAEIHVSNNNYPTKIMLIHGAKATIYVSDYPAVFCTNIDGQVELKRQDEIQ